MSVLALVVQGLLIGVAVALPVGPMALLCIQQTLRSGSLAGLASGLGVASADALYAGLAIAGLAVMQDALAHHQRGFALIGGVILLGLGARLLGRDLPAQAAPLHAGGLAAAYGATLALTLTSPLTIVSFVAIFAALGIQPGDGTLIEGAILVISVFRLGRLVAVAGRAGGLLAPVDRADDAALAEPRRRGCDRRARRVRAHPRLLIPGCRPSCLTREVATLRGRAGRATNPGGAQQARSRPSGPGITGARASGCRAGGRAAPASGRSPPA